MKETARCRELEQKELKDTIAEKKDDKLENIPSNIEAGIVEDMKGQVGDGIYVALGSEVKKRNAL